MRGESSVGRNLKVLLVLDPPDGTTRFVDQVVSELPSWVDVDYFTWRRALTTRYDVLHVHWPERLARGDGFLSTAANRAALLVLLVRLRLLRVALVRTEHNLQPHEPGDAVERWLFHLLRRATTTTIRLNRSTPVDEGQHHVLIPHGHYQAVFAQYPHAAVVPGRLLFFGIIREYKGVERLLETFRALPDPSLSLRLVGKPSSPFWRGVVEDGCAADPRVTATLAFVPDDVLVDEVTQAQLVVLPYMEMHNSGAIFVALSLGRPVLAPRSPVNEELAAEIGPGWIHLFEGELTVEALTAALRDAQESEPGRLPDFVDRDWATVGRSHALVYEEAAARARGVTIHSNR